MKSKPRTGKYFKRQVATVTGDRFHEKFTAMREKGTSTII